MREPMKTNTLFQELASFALGATPSDEQALTFMILVHTHQVWLREPLADREGVTQVCAISRAGAAEELAAFWPDKSDARRTDFKYWLDRYEAETPYEIIDDIPSQLFEGVQRIRDRLLRHPAVLDFPPEY